MPNQLTGDYEAVVQIGVRQIDGMLATLHQAGGSDDAPLKLLHTASMRIGGYRRRPPDLSAFTDWLTAYQKTRPAGSDAPLRDYLTSTAPPGAAKLLDSAFSNLSDLLVAPLPPDIVRGLARVQLGSIRIEFPPGSTSEVTLRVPVRAQYIADPDTTPLPEPIHGEVSVVFVVRMALLFGGRPLRRRLLIQLTPEDSKIEFNPAPASGLNTMDVARISEQVRYALRDAFTLIPVDLPSSFPFAEFKAVGSLPGQALALGLQLSGSSAPVNGLQAVTQSVVGSSGFAFGVSKDYVGGLIDIEAIKQGLADESREVLGLSFHARFSSGPTLTFRSGAIDVSGQVEIESAVLSGYIKFKQPITLVLDAASRMITATRLGDPDVDESWWISHASAVNLVKREIRNALLTNSPLIARTFDSARDDFVEGLRQFDRFASASFTGVEITAEGVIVRGDIRSRLRQAPVVDIRETNDGAGFTAFHSWIPGGRIDRFVWSWVEHPEFSHTPFGGVSKTRADAHRFVLPKPAGITNKSQICLRLEGIVHSHSGQQFPVSGGTTCQVSEPVVYMNVPAWWSPVTVPIWRPDVPDGALARDAIAGHVAVESRHANGDGPAQNALVYFADWKSDKPLAVLADALRRVQDKQHSVQVVVVAPPGAFDDRRDALEARTAAVGERFGAQLHLTEDDEGGWTRIFAPSRTPASFIINARREFVWKHEGEPDAAVLASALEKHLLPTPPLRPAPLRLTVGVGDPAPDAIFQDDRGELYAIHRFRGRPLLLNFWQAWSAPCIAELRRLQRLTQDEKNESPFIVALHGGRAEKGFDQIREQLGIDFPLVHDAEQQVARQYGIRCWPTTVLVDAEGRVEHIQFGVPYEHGKADDRGAQTAP